MEPFDGQCMRCGEDLYGIRPTSCYCHTHLRSDKDAAYRVNNLFRTFKKENCQRCGIELGDGGGPACPCWCGTDEWADDCLKRNWPLFWRMIHKGTLEKEKVIITPPRKITLLTWEHPAIQRGYVKLKKKKKKDLIAAMEGKTSAA